MTATALSLTVEHVDVARADPHGPMLHKFGMTEKKYHEVTEMTKHVASMAKRHGIKQVWYKTMPFAKEFFCTMYLTNAYMKLF